MYKILLADDEILTREAIAENISWEEEGFSLIGAAANGQEAIAMMKKEQPDLLLTDICMPIIDGIALAGYVKEHYPDTRVIVLSGYDEFEYAKQALKHGVSEYLLKPITSLELKEELIKMRQKLDAERSKSEHVTKILKAYEKNIPMMREHFLNRMVEGNNTKIDVKAQTEHLNISLGGNFQSVILISLEDASEFFGEYMQGTEQLVLFAIANISMEITETYRGVFTFQNVNDKCVMILSADSENGLNTLIRELGNEILQSIYQYMKVKVCIIVGKTVSCPEEWYVSYESAKNAKELKFLLDECDYVYSTDFEIQPEKKRIQTESFAERFVLLIKTNQKKEIVETADELFADFRNRICEKRVIAIHLQSIVLTILITLEDNGIEAEEFDKEASFLHSILEYKHLSEMKEHLLKLLYSLADAMADKRECMGKKQAVMALDYIEKNYKDSTMSLNSVCEHLSVSVSYFSTIFKAHTGETFVEKLTKVRIENAKKLMETTALKTYEIAAEVGYYDPHYFSSTFKKLVGKTPTEYVKSVR